VPDIPEGFNSFFNLLKKQLKADGTYHYHYALEGLKKSLSNFQFNELKKGIPFLYTLKNSEV